MPSAVRICGVAFPHLATFRPVSCKSAEARFAVSTPRRSFKGLLMALQASFYWPPLQIERSIQTRFLSILTIPRMEREVRPENTVPAAVRPHSSVRPCALHVRRPHVLPRIIWDERCMRSAPTHRAAIFVAQGTVPPTSLRCPKRRGKQRSYTEWRRLAQCVRHCLKRADGYGLATGRTEDLSGDVRACGSQTASGRQATARFRFAPFRRQV